jgi:hypothetical protein
MGAGMLGSLQRESTVVYAHRFIEDSLGHLGDQIALRVPTVSDVGIHSSLVGGLAHPSVDGGSAYIPKMRNESAKI